MKIPATSLYFKTHGPDATLTRPRTNAHIKPRPKPFLLDGFDANFLWNDHALSHRVRAGRGYFSVPPTVEGALWLQHHGFNPDLLERGSFIGAPMLRAHMHSPGDQLLEPPVNYVLIPSSEVFGPDGLQVREVLPEVPEGLPTTPCPALGLDIHPLCLSSLRDHRPLFWTGTCLNADSAVSRWGATIALHGTYLNGVVPTVQELEQLYLEANLDKLLLEHVFVVDSDEPRTGAFFQTLERLALVLPDVQVAFLRPGENGTPATLARVCVQEDYGLDVTEWGEEF